MILALIDQEKKAEDLFLGLPNRLRDMITLWSLLHFPGRSTGAQETAGSPEYFVIPPGSNENLKLDLSQFTESQPQPKPEVILNARQEEEFAARGYKCRYQLLSPVSRSIGAETNTGKRIPGTTEIAFWLYSCVWWSGYQNSDSGAVTRLVCVVVVFSKPEAKTRPSVT